MIYGFTGTQEGMTPFQKGAIRGLFSLISGELHHGDCIGSDAEAHDIAVELGWEIVIHPPSNPAKRAFKTASRILRPWPYLERNHHIVDATKVLVATPKEYEEQMRSGTWATIRYAQKKHRPILIVYPNGNIQ